MAQRTRKLAVIIDADFDGSPAPRRSAQLFDLQQYRPARAGPDRDLPRLHLEHWLIGALLLASYVWAASAFI